MAMRRPAAAATLAKRPSGCDADSMGAASEEAGPRLKRPSAMSPLIQHAFASSQLGSPIDDVASLASGQAAADSDDTQAASDHQAASARLPEAGMPTTLAPGGASSPREGPPQPEQVPEPVQEDARLWFPALPLLEKLVKKVEVPERAIRVSFPCCGIMGTRPVFEAAGLKVESTNVYEIEASYEGLIKSLTAYEENSTMPRIGLASGDLMKTKLEDVYQSEVIIGGPPCPPWAGNGKHGSSTDSRANIYEQCIKWILHSIDKKHLQAACLENVTGIMQEQNGCQAYLPKALELCEAAAPDFHWDIITLSADDYGLPQSRTRVFLRCLKKVHAEKMPDALPPLGKSSLASFLDPAEKNIKRSDISTSHMRDNLWDYERVIRKRKMQKTEFQNGEIACVTLDRKVDSSFAQIMCDKTPTLTTSLSHPFLLSTHDLHMPATKRQVFRWLTDKERLAIQGFQPHAIAEHLPEGKLRFAAGNAYPS
eukprot:9476096-Pyramimonas_sp.AAC.1